MKWTPENDRKLLIYTSYRDVLPFEHAKIAAMFPGMCTEEYSILEVETDSCNRETDPKGDRRASGQTQE